MSETVLYQLEDHVATITYNRPHAMNAVNRVTSIDFTPEVRPRRPGDPARIVATGELAGRDLNWKMRHTVDDMVASAWAARQAAER